MRPDLESTPKLGFGCMRLPLLDPADQQSIDIPQLEQMVDAFLEGGGTYFDTAFVYHEGASEKALGQALVARHPRESFTIATKCLAWAIGSAEEAKSNLGTSLERLGTDYVDFYLLHNVGGARTAKFDEYGMWDFVREQKATGRIRNWGFSMHDGPETLDALLTAHPDADFVQLQVNYLDWDDPVVQARRCMEVAARHGKPVVVMEPARGGRLVELPEQVAAILRQANPEASLASWAYRFCYQLPGVLTVLSGMSTIGQVRQNVADFRAAEPFSPAERQAFDRAVDELRGMASIPCTNCRYCVKGCPQGVVIPEIMGLLNLELMTGNRDFAKGLYSWAGRARPCLEVRLLRRLRGHVPPGHRHRAPAGGSRRALRVAPAIQVPNGRGLLPGRRGGGLACAFLARFEACLRRPGLELRGSPAPSRSPQACLRRLGLSVDA